jgi:hypothetical protein
MSHEVYADKWEIAGESGMNKSIARFPDVCLSPPSPPAGPIPVPYPDTSFSSDLKKGSKTVKLRGEPAALAQQSYYKPSVLGDEAATRSFGANIITHQITGKTYFQAWSMDVKIEGKNVCRHFDITTSNHASWASTTVPAPTNEAETAAVIAQGLCPCCGEPLHDWQKKDPTDPNSEALPTISQEDFYKRLGESHKEQLAKKKADSALWASLQTKKLEAGHIDFGRFFKPGQEPTIAEVIEKKASAAEDLLELMKKNPKCPLVPEAENSGCGTHFDVPKGPVMFNIKEKGKIVQKPKTYAERCEDAFTPTQKGQCLDEFSNKYPDIPRGGLGQQFHHRTPKQAGGCNSSGNLVPDNFVGEGDCAQIRELQDFLHTTQAKGTGVKQY